jgi:uncharacterized protein
MIEDQRYLNNRPDVLSYQTEILPEDMTIVGEISVDLKIATTGTDADFFVKIIDVYPDDTAGREFTPKDVTLAGFQQMVRSEIMRARFRNSFIKPKPLIANKKTKVQFDLPDILHTFMKGHKIMVQIQSTAFPLFDINPQKYVPNVYKAQKSDFEISQIKIFGDSKITLQKM